MVYPGILFFAFLLLNGFLINIELVGVYIGVRSRIRGVALFYFSLKFPFILYISHNSRFYDSLQYTK